MGEREAPGRPEAEEETRPFTKKPAMFSVKNIVILALGVAIASGLALLTVGGYIAPSIERSAASGQSNAAKSGESASRLDDILFFKLDPLIVNPAGSDGERYLKASITLETYDVDVQRELEKRLPQIKNQINNILASKSIAQVAGSEDRERLRREILNRVNGMIVGGRITNVYFEEFVFQ